MILGLTFFFFVLCFDIILILNINYIFELSILLALLLVNVGSLVAVECMTTTNERLMICSD